jgi:hypothetical protein
VRSDRSQDQHAGIAPPYHTVCLPGTHFGRAVTTTRHLGQSRLVLASILSMSSNRVPADRRLLARKSWPQAAVPWCEAYLLCQSLLQSPDLPDLHAS